jgi:hypothetical protein
MKAATLILALIAFPLLSSIPPVHALDNDTEPTVSQRTQSAIAVWHDYQNALIEGDEEKARACWTETARRYPVFNWHMRFDQAVASARHDSLEISDVNNRGRYVELHITSPHWKHTAWGGPPGRTCYVVPKPQALLAAPFEILTDGWHVRETQHFVCHYPKDARLTDDQARALDEFYSETSSRLGIGLDRHIDYFMCGDSLELVGELLGSGPATGRAGIENRVVTAVGWTSFHEVVHVLIGQTCRKQPYSVLLEGAACYFGGGGLMTRDAQLAWAKTLVENNEAMPLATLLDERGFWSAEDMNDPYAEAAAFTGFLIEKHGIDAYKTLYRYRDGPDSLETALERMSGKNVGQLEVEWEEWLLHLDVPAINLGVDEHATEIFRIDDPANDDNGDGHYVYPLAPGYKPGMFDLTGFRVLSDAKRLYFELTYRDLLEWPESVEWGFGGTFTRMAIDCGGQGEEGLINFRWSANATIAGHCDYLIDISDCGVVLVQGGRIVACLKRAPAGKRLGDATHDRIRFSIPCSEPEESRRRWRYTVAVGGRKGGGRLFRDAAGGFLTVEENPSEQTGGGGSDDDTNPNIYDILLPTDQDQGEILAARPAVLPMVGN